VEVFAGEKYILLLPQMVPLLKKSSDVLVEKMGEFAESGKSVEVFREYGSFTLETLIATAFGRYVNLQRGEADQLTEAASTVFHESTEGASLEPFVLLIGLSNFPWLEPLLSRAIGRSAAGKALKLLYDTATRLIGDRIENPQPPKVKDMVQLMIDATADENFCGTKKLNSEQMAGFSVDFLLAGYETTANTLSYTTYLLAMNPVVQEKLQAEIDQYFEEAPEASLYEAAQNLKYLDMVLKESLRLYTPVPKVMRQCSKTVTVGGVTVPEGAGVVIPIDVIHHLPRYWPDPYKFDPERFTVEAEANRHQLAHMPFGWGPRSCIGMRFALLEAKIALMEILRKYSFARGPETPALLDLERGFTTVPKGGVYVKIIPRK
jgi:thromboxane-A synthase